MMKHNVKATLNLLVVAWDCSSPEIRVVKGVFLDLNAVPILLVTNDRVDPESIMARAARVHPPASTMTWQDHTKVVRMGSVAARVETSCASLLAVERAVVELLVVYAGGLGLAMS